MRPVPRWARWFLVGAASWWGVSRLVVPRVLALLHGAGPNPVSNRLLPGRESIAVDAYLQEWWSRVPSFDYVVLTTSLATLLVLVAVRILRRTPSAASAEEASLPAAARIKTWAGLGAGAGAVAGLGEAYHLAAKLFYLHETPADFLLISSESVWMAPAMDMGIMALLGAGWGVLGSTDAVPRSLHRRIGVTGLVTLGVLSLLGVSGRMHVLAAALLSLGVAVRLAPILTSRWAHLRRWAGGAAAVGAGVAGVLVSGQIGLEAWSDRPPSATSPTGSRPNLLLVVLDTERAGSWSLTGGDRVTDAAMQRWAARGTVFERAIAPANWTLPSHASFLTGRPTWELNVDWSTPLDRRHVTLPEFLGERGYRTGGFVGNLYYTGAHWGLRQGFQRYDDHRPTPALALRSIWLGRVGVDALRDLAGLPSGFVEKPAAEVSEAFLDWLDEDRSRPFFAMLNYVDAHEPYHPPDGQRRYSSPGDPAWLDRGVEADRYPAEVIDGLRDAYEDEIALLDREIGRLLAALEGRGRLENTVVVITSDHGESFGEHGWMDHGTESFHRPQVHVPLVVFGPGVDAPVRSETPVSLSALPATLAGLAGFSDHPFPGDPLPAFGGSVESPPPVIAAFGGNYALVEGDFEYLLRRDGSEELYHWYDDPRERNDLASNPAYASTLRRLRQTLDGRVGGGESGTPGG